MCHDVTPWDGGREGRNAFLNLQIIAYWGKLEYIYLQIKYYRFFAIKLKGLL